MAVKYQMIGLLNKRPFGRQSTAWSKRFFVIKDGFVCYYAETEMKEFTKNKRFNIHPKGIIPLANCDIEKCSEVGHPYSFTIQGDDILAPAALVISAENEYDQERWIEALRQAARVTWDNACMGDSIIRQWEDSHSKLEKERQEQLNQLMDNSEALVNEQIKNDQLQKIKHELEQEKSDSEKMLKDLKDHCQLLQSQLSERTSSGTEIEHERLELQKQTAKLQTDLQQLAEERLQVKKELQNQQEQATKLSEERKNLSSESVQLKDKLSEIEQEQAKLLQEKSSVEGSLKAKEAAEALVMREKEIISEEVEELQSAIQDLTKEKEAKEKELKEEMRKREDAEKRLRAAEESLKRLEKAVDMDSQQNTTTIEEECTRKEEMKADVKTLRKFFENVAFESKVDAKLSSMIKNSLMAKKMSERQAVSVRLSSLHKGIIQPNQPSDKKKSARMTRILMEPLGEV